MFQSDNSQKLKVFLRQKMCRKLISRILRNYRIFQRTEYCQVNLQISQNCWPIFYLSIYRRNNYWYYQKKEKMVPLKKLHLYFKSVLEIRTVFRADRGSGSGSLENKGGSRIADLNPCKNTRIRIPDLRIRISNTGSEALFPGRIDRSLSYHHLLHIQCLKPPLLSSIVKLSLCTCLFFFFMLAFN